MSWILGILAVVLVLDGLRMRGRLAALARLPEQGANADDFTAVTAAGAALSDDVRARAAAHCRAHALEAVDIVPGHLPTQRALALAALVDPRRYRDNRLAPGRTAGHALVLSESLAARADIATGEAPDPIALLRAAARAKAYACTATDLAVAPGLTAAPDDPDKRLAVTREVVGGAATVVLVAQLVVAALLIAGVALPGARAWGIAALAVYQLQPLLALAGTPLAPRDLPLLVLLRLPVELWTCLRTIAGRWRPTAPDPVETRRALYAEAMSHDPARLFEARRQDCPVCSSGNLSIHLRTRDLLQHKPGTFTLERCGDCDHIFQNPRLSLEGLEFYYRDFYDGLGEKGMDFIFGFESSSYRARAEMVKSRVTPERWLDVGTGHGHFCCIARELLPQTRFDGLDLSESIEEAARRGWVETGIRALFPDKAGDIAGGYDVVSMHHYLEHTLDPAAELDAARTTLADGGHLLIEVPDPQSRLGRLLGRYWIPWFQPQHQHLLSVGNLERMLRERGFTPVQWHRAEAHQRVDFLFALFLFLDRIAPPTNVPWRPKAGVLRRAWRTTVWTLGTPLVPMAALFDYLIDPAVRRLGASNTYRVLAQKTGPQSSTTRATSRDHAGNALPLAG